MVIGIWSFWPAGPIPYSSGLKLKPQGIGAKKRETCSSNPLLIGAIVRTEYPVSARGGPYGGRNPLLVGAGIRTNGSQNNARKGNRSQSPTHRGGYSDCHFKRGHDAPLEAIPGPKMGKFPPLATRKLPRNGHDHPPCVFGDGFPLETAHHTEKPLTKPEQTVLLHTVMQFCRKVKCRSAPALWPRQLFPVAI